MTNSSHLLDDAARERPAIGMNSGQVVGLLDDGSNAAN
jgi:hypothetical protein